MQTSMRYRLIPAMKATRTRLLTTDSDNVERDQVGFSTGRNTDNTLKAPSKLVAPEDNSATVVMILCIRKPKMTMTTLRV